METVNRDAEFLKIQVYADKMHTLLTVQASLAFAVFSLLAIFYTLFYEGVFQFKVNMMLTGWEGIFVILALVLASLSLMVRDYKLNSTKISDMIDAVNNGHILPSLVDLPKWKKAVNKEVITEKKNGGAKEINKGEQHQNKKNMWLAIWGIGVAFLIQVIYDGFGFYGKSIQVFIGVAISAVLLLGLAIYALRNFNQK
jgi:hypothetical protein